MRASAVKSIIRRVCFPDGARRRIRLGPLRGFDYEVSQCTGMAPWYSGHSEIERPIQEAIALYAKPGDLVLDIGANWGLHTLLASRIVGATGRVLAFEPNPTVNTILRKHVTMNALQNVQIYQEAVADAVGWMGFTVPDGEYMTGRLAPETSEGGVRVPVTTIDTVIDGLGQPRVALIKIDVEGAEARVVAGAARTIQRDRPAIIVELHAWGPADLETTDQLRGFGYALYHAWNRQPVLQLDVTGPNLDGVWGQILATYQGEA